jgi:inosine-uridine nucleoside N-ribohydrolase
VTLADTDRLEQFGTRTARAFAGLLRFFARFHAERYGWDGAPIHDAVAIAHLLAGNLVRTTPFRIAIATDGEDRGRTVATPSSAGDPGSVQVGIGIDREAFVSVLFDAVATFP